MSKHHEAVFRSAVMPIQVNSFCSVFFFFQHRAFFSVPRGQVKKDCFGHPGSKTSGGCGTTTNYSGVLS